MALIERFMGLEYDGSFPKDPFTKKLRLQEVRAYYGEIIRNNGPTTTDFLVKFGIRNIPDESSRSDLQDLQALIALGPPPSNISGRLEYRDRIFEVLALAERCRPPGYSTPAEVRTKLGI